MLPSPTAPSPPHIAAATPAAGRRLLLVDDEPSIVRALSRALRLHFGSTLEIDCCHGGAEAVEELLARAYDVVVSDLRMPGMGGMALLGRAAELQPDCVRLILTGTADFATAQEAVNNFGIFRYLTKPWDAEALRHHVGEALAQAQMQRQRRDEALAWQASHGRVSAAEIERHRLEALEPGITRVEWDEDGCIVMAPLGPAGAPDSSWSIPSRWMP